MAQTMGDTSFGPVFVAAAQLEYPICRCWVEKERKKKLTCLLIVVVVDDGQRCDGENCDRFVFDTPLDKNVCLSLYEKSFIYI